MKGERDWHDRVSLIVASAALLVSCLGWYSSHSQLGYTLNQLRAYIDVVDTETPSLGPDGGFFIANLKIKNTGQTPAQHVKVINIFNVVPYASAETRTYNVPPRDTPVPSTTLGSQQDIVSRQVSTFSLSPAQMEAYSKKIAAFVSRGVIYYSDIFGNEHYTIYCVILKVDTPALSCPQSLTTDASPATIH